MPQCLLTLGRAKQAPGTTRYDLAFEAFNRRITDRAAVRKNNLAGIGRAPFRQYRNHLWNDITGPANDHRVTDFDA